MVERQEVERWLSVCTVAGHDTPDGDNSHASFEVSAPTLAALCRAWLAVNEAPEVCVGKSAVMGAGWQIYGTDGDNIESLPFEAGQRVRIVREGECLPSNMR